MPAKAVAATTAGSPSSLSLRRFSPRLPPPESPSGGKPSSALFGVASREPASEWFEDRESLSKLATVVPAGDGASQGGTMLKGPGNVRLLREAALDERGMP